MKIKLFVPVFSTCVLLLVGCGGGSDTETDTELETETESSGTNIIDPSAAPLLNFDGAEAGLQGCLNRGLYVNGPHTLDITTTETFTRPYWETTTNDTIKRLSYYDVIGSSEEGVYEVDVSTTTTRNLGNTNFSSVSPYTLEGYQLRIVGLSRDTPKADAYIKYFDLEEGVSLPQTVNINTIASPIYYTFIDTYVGREEITIAGRVVKTCRVDSLILSDSEEEEFRRSSVGSRWYGLGTGIELRRESITEPDSEQDELHQFEEVLTAVLNGVELF